VFFGSPKDSKFFIFYLFLKKTPNFPVIPPTFSSPSVLFSFLFYSAQLKRDPKRPRLRERRRRRRRRRRRKRVFGRGLYDWFGF